MKGRSGREVDGSRSIRGGEGRSVGLLDRFGGFVRRSSKIVKFREDERGIEILQPILPHSLECLIDLRMLLTKADENLPEITQFALAGC